MANWQKGKSLWFRGNITLSLTERWDLKHRVPTPRGPLGCGVEDTVTESRPGLSPKRKGGLGGSGPCLAALPACDVGSVLGKLLLLSSHHTRSILIRPDCTFPSSRPQPQGTVQIVLTYAHVCTCATIDCNSKDKRLISIMNIIAPCICKLQPWVAMFKVLIVSQQAFQLWTTSTQSTLLSESAYRHVPSFFKLSIHIFSIPFHRVQISSAVFSFLCHVLFPRRQGQRAIWWVSAVLAALMRGYHGAELPDPCAPLTLRQQQEMWQEERPRKEEKRWGLPKGTILCLVNSHILILFIFQICLLGCNLSVTG